MTKRNEHLMHGLMASAVVAAVYVLVAQLSGMVRHQQQTLAVGGDDRLSVPG